MVRLVADHAHVPERVDGLDEPLGVEPANGPPPLQRVDPARGTGRSTATLPDAVLVQREHALHRVGAFVVLDVDREADRRGARRRMPAPARTSARVKSVADAGA